MARDGKPNWSSEYQKSLFYDFFSRNDGKKIYLSVDTKSPSRTERQNRYLWLYYNIISDETGNDPKVIHAWAKQHCMPTTETEIFGMKTIVERSTTTLEKIDEFSKYIEKISELSGVPPPDPDPFALPMTHEEYRSIRKKQEEKIIR